MTETRTPSGLAPRPYKGGIEVARNRMIQDLQRRQFHSDRASQWPPTLPRRRQDGTCTGMLLGKWTCYLVFGLSVVYMGVAVTGFVSQGGLAHPLVDPYLAIMELLILVLAPALIVVFATVHVYAAPAMRSLSLSALVLVAVMAGITVSVHTVLLTVGRQANEATLPGFTLLFSWTWPSATYALDIVTWDFFLGLALVLAAPVFGGGGLESWVRKGLLVSGTLCMIGMIGMPLGNMQFRDIGVLGYGVVLPVVILLMGRIFARSVTVDRRDDLVQGAQVGNGVVTR